MADAFVEVQHVTARYHAKDTHDVLRDVSFSMNMGDHVVLFGLPASGKSSLLKLLCGDLSYISGSVVINGQKPVNVPALRSGYASLGQNDFIVDTVFNALHVFGEIHGIQHLPARIGEISQILGIDSIMHKNTTEISTTQEVLYRIARVALSDAPLVLLDDVVDALGVEEVQRLLKTLFEGRTVLLTTRIPLIAEQLGLPLLVIHSGTVVHAGTRNDIAHASGVPRVIDAWVEGLRYDLLRSLRSHTGVLEVRVLPTDRFEGSRVRITIRNSRFMPSLYDLMSQASLVYVEELPPSMADIISSLS